MQLRTFLAISAIGLALACVAGFASAQQIYKWKDANGVTHFSQSPPGKGVHYTVMHLLGQPNVDATPATPAANNNVEPNPGATPHIAIQKNIPDNPSNRASLCRQLASNIALLQSKQPVVTSGNGSQAVLSDNAREQQLATARAQQAQYCASGGQS